MYDISTHKRVKLLSICFTETKTIRFGEMVGRRKVVWKTWIQTVKEFQTFYDLEWLTVLNKEFLKHKNNCFVRYVDILYDVHRTKGSSKQKFKHPSKSNIFETLPFTYITKDNLYVTLFTILISDLMKNLRTIQTELAFHL